MYVIKYYELSPKPMRHTNRRAGGVGLFNANRISGRQQEPEGTREEVPPMALYELLESISFTEWRMSRVQII